MPPGDSPTRSAPCGRPISGFRMWFRRISECVIRRVRRYLQVIARLKPGVSIGAGAGADDPGGGRDRSGQSGLEQGHPIGVRPLHDHIVGARTKSWMLMLLGAVGIVLLIACANIANLLLARASAREREVGGSRRARRGPLAAVRQLMVESLCSSAVGTVSPSSRHGGPSRCSAPRCRTACRASRPSRWTCACSARPPACRSSPVCCSGSFQRCKLSRPNLTQRAEGGRARRQRGRDVSGCAACSSSPKSRSPSSCSSARRCSSAASSPSCGSTRGSARIMS